MERIINRTQSKLERVAVVCRALLSLVVTRDARHEQD